jgi:hypothetical protein
VSNAAARLVRAAKLNDEMRDTAAEMAEVSLVYLRGGFRRDGKPDPRRAEIFWKLRETWLRRAGQLVEAADLVTEAPRTRGFMPLLPGAVTPDELRAEALALRTAAYCRTYPQ